MAKHPARKQAKPMGRKQMKKTAGGYGGFQGGVTVAAGDVNGDNTPGLTIGQGAKVTPRSFTGGV